MEWLEIRVGGNTGQIGDFLAAEDITELVIEDGDELSGLLSQGEKFWDKPSEELLELERLSRVTFYLPDDESGHERLASLSPLLAARGWTVEARHVKDSDWEANWMRYYNPIPVGQRLLILPDWLEKPSDAGRRIVLRMDPGLIFGTGSHPTTRMCLEAAEAAADGAESVLDLGCGSGILAAAAILLGAKRAFGLDIDPMAPDIARRNAALNGIYSDQFDAACGDVSSFYPKERYDIVFANIVADVILSILPNVPRLLSPGGLFICSGIIDGRQAEIEAAAGSAGLGVEVHREDSDWHCYTMMLN